MPRPFNFPTPQGVTIGNPTMFVMSDLAMNLYNQDSDNADLQAQRFSQRVKDWFEREAYLVGWSFVGFPGDNSGVMLQVNVQIMPNPQHPQNLPRP